MLTCGRATVTTTNLANGPLSDQQGNHVKISVLVPNDLSTSGQGTP